MSETWEETKRRLKLTLGIGVKPDVKEETPKVRYDEVVTPKGVRLFDIHKRSLPVGIDTVVVFNLTKSEAEQWIEKKLKTKVFTDDARDTKTLIYYDMIPQDATPKERSIYFNTRPITREGGSEPKAIEIIQNDWVG